ncbi:hypothetical protein Asulf_01779 [Archaeoglobus sulfaticallidus PM70-1]|uniref:Uncharacterized protein n=1 Tax=Archaeoglobus sulfaticallidus PM70-1 TaxID=387631 RepID=N0BN70_9EURY|nr:hypothetical protein [Archaeoglobus sulfaticallidus]AGK61750.1 hypothetical protein Asulf_01779 [Archaeoglobus sulfaticallidus PM70-1]
MEIEKEYKAVHEKVLERKRREIEEAKSSGEIKSKAKKQKNPNKNQKQDVLSWGYEEKLLLPSQILVKHSHNLKLIELDRSITSKREIKAELKIPKIELLNSPKIKLLDLKMDLAFNDRKEELDILVPDSITLDEASLILKSFDTTVKMAKDYEEVPTIEKELVQTSEEHLDFSAISAENEPSGGSEEIKEETPDIVDLVFGVSNSRLSSKGPKIVLYRELEKDSTIGSFETLCIMIYREKTGGYLRFKPIKELDEFNVMEIGKWMEVHGSLFTIDLDCNKKKVREWFTQNNLREPIRRAIIGDVGFIIFKTRDAELYEHCKKVLEKLEKEIEHPLNIMYVEPRRLSFEEKKELSSLVWGCLNLNSIPSVFVEEKGVERPYGATFDDIFNKYARREFEERLEKLEGSAYSMATKPHEGESPEHKQMKWFVVKCLTKELIKKGIIKPENPRKPKKYEIDKIIKTEEDTREFLGGVIADVMDTSSNEVYEVETLFAQDTEGKTVEEKIIYTIEKYKELTNVRKINIIMDNFTFLRHFKTLIDIKENEPEEIREKVEFYTLDLEKEKLVPLKEIKRKLRNIHITIKAGWLY